MIRAATVVRAATLGAFLFAVSQMPAAQSDPAEKNCLTCHDAAKLESLKRDGKRGLEVIPEDPVERAAFAALMGAADPARRKELAASFLKSYPSSWMLEPAYEIASKASIAIGDFPSALEYGEQSLRLLPENPFLLVALADVRMRKGDFPAAERTAQDALWYLERFDRPSSIDAGEWPRAKSRIQAQAHLVIGRAAASEAQSAVGGVRAQRFADAESALRQSLSLDPASASAAFLLGMVNLNQGRFNEGAAFLALAAKVDGPVRAQALDRLRAVYADGATTGGRPFDEWAASLKPALPQAAVEHRAPVPRQYAGTAACQDCHKAEHASWRTTGMGRMFRDYRPQDVIGDFTSGQSVPDDAGKPVARAVVRDGRHYMEIRNGEAWKSYPVDYLIGSKWQQGYATKLPGGEIQVFPLQYNVAHRSWVNYWEIKDPANSARTVISRFHETAPGATYQLECAVCHTSQQRFAGATFAGRTLEAKASSFREGGINCEMCHGPSGPHAAAMRAGHPVRKDPAEPPVDFPRIAAPEYVAICAQCHMQTGLRDPEASGALNYSETGDKFYRTLLSRPYVDYSRRGFYKDGRFRETVFIVESFVRSACFRKGGAQCGNCHDPHPRDAASNPKSLKFGADSDRMCIGCHAKYQSLAEAHTHHAASSEASRCVTCHMPRIMNALMFQARYHQIDDVPDAEMAARFGREESPNACLMCHKDRDAAWLRRTLQSWREKNGSDSGRRAGL